MEFQTRPTPEELDMDKSVLPERQHLSEKITDEHFEAIKDGLDRNQDVFLRHEANIG